MDLPVIKKTDDRSKQCICTSSNPWDCFQEGDDEERNWTQEEVDEAKCRCSCHSQPDNA